MKAIYNRELSSYYNKMTGCIFMTVYLLAGGLFFSVASILGGNVRVTPVLYQLRYVLLIIAPVLTAGLLAEERRSGTGRMLLTAPVRVRAIVAGKFFSAFTVFLAALIVSLIYPVILSVLGKPSWSEIITGYAGLLLFGGALMSIGLFISSLTQNRVTAAAVTLGITLALLLTETLSPQIGNEFIRTALMKSMPSYYLYFFQYGIISLPAILYFLSVMFLFLFLTAQMIERQRWARG